MAKQLHTPVAGEVIDRLRRVAEAPSDTALSAFFGYGTTAVSNWRQRDRVPYAECVDLAKRKGVSLDWLVFGEPHPPSRDGVGEYQTVEYLARFEERDDPRAERMVGFIRDWAATRESDEVAWLERTLARTVPEYGTWLVMHKD